MTQSMFKPGDRVRVRVGGHKNREGVVVRTTTDARIPASQIRFGADPHLIWFGDSAVELAEQPDYAHNPLWGAF